MTAPAPAAAPAAGLHAWLELSRQASDAALKAQEDAAKAFTDALFRTGTDLQEWFGQVARAGWSVRRIAEGPQFADLGTIERQQARVLKAWLALSRHRLEHQALLQQAWLRAGCAFAAAVARRTQADGQMPTGSALLALWTEAANHELVQTLRSEPFLRIQGERIRTGSELKLAQRGIAERWASQFDLPTRTELDDVHRTVTELRRELRVLQRQARLHAAVPPAVTPSGSTGALAPPAVARATPSAAPAPAACEPPDKDVSASRGKRRTARKPSIPAKRRLAL